MAADSAEVAYNQRLTIGIVVTCLLLSVLSFGLRIYARMITAAKLWYDDYWMFFVMALAVAMTTSDFIGLQFGSGQHQADLDPSSVLVFMKNLYVYMLLWSVGVFSVKVGILLFYWRVFQTRQFRVSAVAVAALSTGIFFSNFFSFTFQCWPVSTFWTNDPTGKCFDQNTFYFASAIINVVGDVAVLCLPLPVVWSLHTTRTKKWSLSFLFLLGAFVCLASVFRIIAVKAIIPTDFTFSNVSGGLWSTAEVEIGFICANLPALRPLMTKWFHLGDSRTGYSSNSGQRSGNMFTGNKSGLGTSRKTGHVMLGSKTGNDSGADDFTKHANSSDEIELTGRSHDGKFGTIRVETDVEMSWVDVDKQKDTSRHINISTGPV